MGAVGAALSWRLISTRLIDLGGDRMLLSTFWVRFDEGIDHARRTDSCRSERQR
jgi:hypothetical protein